LLKPAFGKSLKKENLPKKKKMDNFTNPSNFSHFCKHPPNIQKLSLTHLELSKILTYPHPYKLGNKFLKKDQNTPVFYLKKIKKISGSWNFIQKSPFKIHYLKCQLPKCFFYFF
jgi:hypothetical protein